MKKQKKIKLTTIMDVKEFVTAASECDFDVNVYYKYNMMVDAKSVLGVLSLDLSQVLTVEYNGENSDLEEFLNKKAEN